MYFANNDSKKLIMIAKFSASLTRSHPHPRYRVNCHHPKLLRAFEINFICKDFMLTRKLVEIAYRHKKKFQNYLPYQDFPPETLSMLK